MYKILRQIPPYWENPWGDVLYTRSTFASVHTRITLETDKNEEKTRLETVSPFILIPWLEGRGWRKRVENYEHAEKPLARKTNFFLIWGGFMCLHCVVYASTRCDHLLQRSDCEGISLYTEVRYSDSVDSSSRIRARARSIRCNLRSFDESPWGIKGGPLR